MGDFILDFRPQNLRQTAKALELLKFMHHVQGAALEELSFGVGLTFTGDPTIWAPYKSRDGIIVAIAGRVCLDESQWMVGEAMPGDGGLASKALCAIYRQQGLAGLERLGGNYFLFVYDPNSSQCHLITDPAGVFPVYYLDVAGPPVFASHPDVLAAVTGEQRNLDEVSLTEFLLTSTVTPPYTYYNRIRALEFGTTATVQITPDGPMIVERRRYFEMMLVGSCSADEAELAEELAVALRNAVLRRTLPRLGRTAVALSGGLDSRVILACVENREETFAFCCYDRPNREFRSAKAIAEAMGVPFKAWQRPFEYYGENAELGVRISGGMGTIANNHFLGIVDRLREEGTRNLLTGCYCDYLFKGLPLNRSVHWLTGREWLAPYRHQFYFTHHQRPTAYRKQIEERWESRVPSQFQAQRSDADIFQVEARRTFPLCYEGDNQQRVVPQRVTGWCPPIVDRGVLEVYRKIPWRFKLNRSIFLAVARRLCPASVLRIPDANTGAPLDASLLRECLSTKWLRFRSKLRVGKHSISSDGSWPDWYYYVRHSAKLRELWQRPNALATDFFRRVLRPEELRANPADYSGPDIWLMIRILTLKLWFDQWHG